MNSTTSDSILKNKKDWSRVWLNDDVSDPTRRRREAMRASAILCREGKWKGRDILAQIWEKIQDDLSIPSLTTD